MSKADKIKIVVGILVVLILMVLIIVAVKMINLTPSKEKNILPEEKTEEEKKVVRVEKFSLTGVISKVYTKDNYLLVKTTDDKQEVKVILNKNTKIIKSEVPIDLKTAEKGTVFTLENTDVGIPDLKTGDKIFIKTIEDINDKTEFDSVDYIEVLP